MPLPLLLYPYLTPQQRKDELEYWLTEHLRLNGVYWGLTALHLMGRGDALPRDETIEFVLSCQHDNGGFGAAPGHDSHLLSTVSAVQILAMVDALEVLERRGKAGDGGRGKLGVGKCMSALPFLAQNLRPQALGSLCTISRKFDA
jgi:geranylgeranyl transferase type-2 subunit beta